MRSMPIRKALNTRLVESVNGLKIKELEDLDRAFQKDMDGYWEIRFLGNNTPLVMDADKARQRHDLIRQKYNVPAQ